MRYPASEKLEIIRLVENSHQPVKKKPDQIGVSRPTVYRWYDDLYRRFADGGLEHQAAALAASVTAPRRRCLTRFGNWRSTSRDSRPVSWQ